MPDLDVVSVPTCKTNVLWETVAIGSKGDRYRVAFESTPDSQDSVYGWTCECKGFQYRGGCRHVTEISKSGERCAWNETLEPGVKANEDRDGNAFCPLCGSDVEYVMVGV